MSETVSRELCMPERTDARIDARALYEAHAERLRRAVVRLGGPDLDANDLVHDVFVIALSKQAEFEGRSAPLTWLYGIAIKVVAGARRRARLRRLLGLAHAVEPSSAARPADPFEQREASATVYRLLEKLSEKKRSVFILYELDELSGEEIAAIVGCPLKTVWTRLHHARREFRRLLEREEGKRVP